LDRTERLIFRLIFVIVILIEGWKFIRFVAGGDETKPSPPKIERLAIPAKPAESPPTDII
jgi:hypothetical protein